MHNAFRHILRGALLSAAFVGLATQAGAQTPPAQTGIASPGRAEQQLPKKEFEPRIAPKVEVKKVQVQGVPAGAENITFQLSGIVMDGATVYPEETLRRIYADRVGTTISLADLYQIAAELTVKYRNDGYILTQVIVPPQTIDGGVARLQIVEGTVDKIDVQGPDDGSLNLIRAYASRIQTSGPLNTKDLERSLLLINDLPGVSARSILNPSKTRPGAADLAIIVERKPYDAELGFDNFGTRFLGTTQASAAGSLNSPFGNNDRITAQLVAAGDHDWFKEMRYGALGYDIPIWTHGTLLQLFGSHTQTEPGYTLEQFDVEGWSTNASAQVMHPFIRSRSMNLSGRAKLDYREVTTKNNIPLDPTRKDHIRALRLGGRFEVLDNILSAIGVAYNTFDVEVSHGLDVLGANSSRQLDTSRPGADPTFLKMNVEAQRLQRVADDVNLLLGVSGQIANDGLLSSEQFGVGGQAYGRGYDPSEIIGDDGIAGKIELQWDEPYEFSLMDSYQLYGFYDVGHIWDGSPAFPSQKVETLASTGLGIRADFDSLTTAGFMVAVPLNRTPQTDNDQSPRVYFNINRRF